MKRERKDQILKCIVEEFIRTAAPVGSKTLLEKYKLDCSSATIRNAMAELEEEGYLEKQHVSSGRVPSAKGYQYYLEKLDNSSLAGSVDLQFQREFQNVLKSKSQSMEDVLSQSCEMLSEMTNTATLVLGPKASQESLVSVQMLRLSPKAAMGIFITDSGYVEKKTFVLSDKSDKTFDKLSEAVELLNNRLAGTKISDLPAKAEALKPLLIQMYGQSGDLVMQAFLETLVAFASSRYKVYGQKNLLSLPEFSEDKESFLSAFDALQNPDSLEKNYAEKDDIGHSVNVAFTNANKGDFAIVSKPINDKDSIAVVGPKRMDYKKVLSALEYVVYMLNKYYFSPDESSTSLVPISEPEELPVKVNGKKKTSNTKTTNKKKGGHR